MTFLEPQPYTYTRWLYELSNISNKGNSNDEQDIKNLKGVIVIILIMAMKNRIVEQWDRNKKNAILIWNLNTRRNFMRMMMLMDVKKKLRIKKPENYRKRNIFRKLIKLTLRIWTRRIRLSMLQLKSNKNKMLNKLKCIKLNFLIS